MTYASTALILSKNDFGLLQKFAAQAQNTAVLVDEQVSGVKVGGTLVVFSAQDEDQVPSFFTSKNTRFLGESLFLRVQT